jgi:hypothetical protein
LRFGSCVMRLASGAGRTSIGCYVIRKSFISLGSTGCMRFPLAAAKKLRELAARAGEPFVP